MRRPCRATYECQALIEGLTTYLGSLVVFNDAAQRSLGRTEGPVQHVDKFDRLSRDPVSVPDVQASRLYPHHHELADLPHSSRARTLYSR